MFSGKFDEVTGQLKQIFEPWTTLIDARIQAIDKAARDKCIDLDRLTTNVRFREVRLKRLYSGDRQKLDAKLAEIRGTLLPGDVRFGALRDKLAGIQKKDLPL